MKSPGRISIGVLLVLVAATLTECGVGQRLRLIRRITASDLPAPLNTSLSNDSDISESTTQQTKPNNPINSPQALNITEVFSTSTSSNRPLQLNITEILDTSATTNRRQRLAVDQSGIRTTTEAPKTNVSEAQLRSRRPYLKNRVSLERKNLSSTEKVSTLESFDNVAKSSNSNEISSNITSASDTTVDASTNSSSNATEIAGNCNSTDLHCEQKPAANVESTILLTNITANEVVKEVSKKAILKEKPQEPPVRTTDRTFSNVVSSSTARVVLQENIHTDILRHLTTPSYAHYETDYVMDDDSDAYDSESNHMQVSTKSYDHYDTKEDYNVSYTTPDTKRFDEIFASVSEGIRQNLDEFTARNKESEGSSEEHFGSSSENDETVETSSDAVPKNDTKVSLEFVNHVHITANDSATANSRHGDIVVDNGTHVDFQRSSIETKVIPEISSTVKYIIDDEYSTTKRIITQEEETNSIKDESSNVEKVSDQSSEGAEPDEVKVKVEEATTVISVEKDVVVKEKEVVVKEKDLKPVNATNNPKEAENVQPTTTRTSTQGRTRMFSSKQAGLNPYNTNNTVEQSATEAVEKKRTRLRLTNTVDIISSTASPRSRTRSSSTPRYSSTTSRRYTTESVATSPRNTVMRRPLNRSSNNSTKLGDLEVNNEGNDILTNDNYRANVRRGTVKFGGVKSADDDDEFPIPPTAAAWSLATMKEPGRRTKLQGSNSTTRPQEILDSEASGSYTKQTTIYNVIAPTSNINATRDTTDPNAVTGTTEAIGTEKPDVDDGNVQVTEIPSADEVTTTDVPTTTVPSDDKVTTGQPDEVTTIRDALDEVVEDDDLRFDGVSKVTTQIAESDVDDEVTTEVSRVSTTTETYATTRVPKEDVDKIADEEKEEDGEIVNSTPEPVGEAVAAEDGGLLGVNAGENSQEGQQDLHGEIKDVVINPKVQEETRIEGNTNVNQDVRTENVKAGDEESQKEEGNVKLPSEGSQHGESNSHGEEESDDEVPNLHEAEADSPINEVQEMGKKTPTGTALGDTTEAVNTTTESVVTSTTATPTGTTEVEDSSPDASNIHTFMRVFVEGSMAEFCDLKTIFKKAVADLLTEGTSKSVTVNEVIIRNIGAAECDAANATDSVPGQLIPVEMHIVDSNGNYDQQLNDAFPLLWGHSDLDFQMRIRKVDVVDESPAYSGSAGGNGAVIAAITISCIGAVCLLILAFLLVVMRKRQKKVNYGMRCTPVSLDAYSLDSVSVHGSTRRKSGLRASKRSYGNPAFDDPTTPTHPMNFASLASFTSDRDGIEEEFSNIPHVTPNIDELPDGAERKNRYANIIPLPETRVVLSTIEEEPLSDYINANYVRGPKNAIKCYIACQAPMQGTVTDFWRMVWEQQTKVIMMLTDLVENGVEKCADYLPPSEVLDCHRLFGDYQVTLKKREVREAYVISTLQLKNMESNTWREVTHLWYLTWPNQGVPEEPSSIIAFLIEARSYMKNSSGPSIVHCSPGTGRTGTLLACDLCIREFEQTRLVDVPKCVSRLRKDRAGCVQTRDQYAFIYQVLNLYATTLTGGALDSI